MLPVVTWLLRCTVLYLSTVRCRGLVGFVVLFWLDFGNRGVLESLVIFVPAWWEGGGCLVSLSYLGLNLALFGVVWDLR